VLSLLVLLPVLLAPLLLAFLLPLLPVEGGVGAAAAALGSALCGGGNDDAVCDFTRPHKTAARVQVILCFHITASNAGVGTKGGIEATVAELGKGGACAVLDEDEFATVLEVREELDPLLSFWRSASGTGRRNDVFNAERGACKPLLSFSTFETEVEVPRSAPAITAQVCRSDLRSEGFWVVYAQ